MHTILPLEENPVIRDVSRSIPSANIRSKKIQTLISDMKKLLAKEPYGVALAAVQVGEPVRLFIVAGRALALDTRNAPDEPKNHEASLHGTSSAVVADQIYINPVLRKVSRKKTDKHEGCLSVRGKWGEVPRAEKATLQYVDEEGHPQTRGASGFLAHIFQHEMDHLEGILYTDKASAIYDEQPKT